MLIYNIMYTYIVCSICIHVYTCTLLSPLCQPSKLLDTYVYWASLLLYICMHACLLRKPS